MRITRTLAAVLAIGAVAAPVAAAQPVADMHASTAIAVAKERQNHDLRSPDARDARIRLHRSGLTVGTTPPAVQPPAPAAPAAKTTADRDDVDWTTVALGIAGSLSAVAGVALVASRRRTPRPRPSA